MNRLLTVKDIQEIFSCSKPRAYAIMHSSGFPTIAINERLYVDEHELEQWIKSYSGRQFIV